MIEWLLACFAFVALDFSYARYTITSSGRRPIAAGLWAVSILAFSGYATIAYTRDPWLLIPCGIGAFTGTFFAVREE